MISLTPFSHGSDRQTEIFRYLLNIHYHVGVSFHSMNHSVHYFYIMFLLHNIVILVRHFAFDCDVFNRKATQRYLESQLKNEMRNSLFSMVLAEKVICSTIDESKKRIY